MVQAFEDESLGLVLKGYNLLPNSALETKVAVYTPEIVQVILSEHPEIVDKWLQKLHKEYIASRKSCDFENDPVACFNVTAYEEFEKHFKAWEDGGLIAISLSRDRAIRVRKTPLISIAPSKDANDYLVCDKCQAAFADLGEFEKHYRQEIDAVKSIEKKKQEKKKEDSYRDIPPNPIWWLT